MTLLILGIVLFFGIHSLQLIAPGRREHYRARLGVNAFRALYSLLSIIAIALLIYGYGQSRADPVFLYQPALWTRHLALTLTLVAFILVAASLIPANHLRAKLGHAGYAGIKVWAFAHLLANGRLGDVLLFGSFLVWAIAGFAIRRRQDRRAGITQAPGTWSGTLGALVAGIAAWVLFAFGLHQMLIGVNPLPF